MNMQILKMVTENQVKTTQESKEKKDNTRSTLKRCKVINKIQIFKYIKIRYPLKC